MDERDVVDDLITSAFRAKARLNSEKTALLQTLLAVLIMEAENVRELLSDPDPASDSEVDTRPSEPPQRRDDACQVR
jgi:hypothetical protein